jgi:prepilin-type N-terminal cleavage/methylation domain-containing protein
MEVQELKTTRRGFTLVEMIIVITAVAVILAITTVLMHFVLQMDSEVRQRTRAVTNVGRLAEQFRRDAHAAIADPIVTADHRAAEFHLADGKVIKWQADDARGLVRTEPLAGAGDHAGVVSAANREDSFALPPGTTATLELQPPGAARIVTIRIDSPRGGGPSMAIEALASRDRRFAVEEEEKP